MRRMYLEVVRMILNTIICMFIFGAGVELNSNYLQVIAGLMWMSHLIASTERKTVWDATKKKSSYREEFPKKWILQLNIVVCEDINHAHS